MPYQLSISDCMPFESSNSISNANNTDNIVQFPIQKHSNSRPGNHNHTQQRVSPIRDPKIVVEIYKALKASGRYGIRNASIFALQLAIGRRTNDILSLKVGDVYDIKTNEVKTIITVDEHKTGKTARDLPINTQTRIILKDYIRTLKHRKSDSLLFPSQKLNQDGTQRPLNTSSLDGIYKVVTEVVYKKLNERQCHSGLSNSQGHCDLGTTHISSYAARKTYGYNLYTECMEKHNGMLPGTDISALQYVQSVFGHESSNTTLRYIGAYDAPAMKLVDDISQKYDFN